MAVDALVAAQETLLAAERSAPSELTPVLSVARNAAIFEATNRTEACAPASIPAEISVAPSTHPRQKPALSIVTDNLDSRKFASPKKEPALRNTDAKDDGPHTTLSCSTISQFPKVHLLVGITFLLIFILQLVWISSAYFGGSFASVAEDVQLANVVKVNTNTGALSVNAPAAAPLVGVRLETENHRSLLRMDDSIDVLFDNEMVIRGPTSESLHLKNDGSLSFSATSTVIHSTGVLQLESLDLMLLGEQISAVSTGAVAINGTSVLLTNELGTAALNIDRSSVQLQTDASGPQVSLNATTNTLEMIVPENGGTIQATSQGRVVIAAVQDISISSDASVVQLAAVGGASKLRLSSNLVSLESTFGSQISINSLGSVRITSGHTSTATLEGGVVRVRSSNSASDELHMNGNGVVELLSGSTLSLTADDSAKISVASGSAMVSVSDSPTDAVLLSSNGIIKADAEQEIQLSSHTVSVDLSSGVFELREVSGAAVVQVKGSNGVVGTSTELATDRYVFEKRSPGNITTHFSQSSDVQTSSDWRDVDGNVFVEMSSETNVNGTAETSVQFRGSGSTRPPLLSIKNSATVDEQFPFGGYLQFFNSSTVFAKPGSIDLIPDELSGENCDCEAVAAKVNEIIVFLRQVGLVKEPT